MKRGDVVLVAEGKPRPAVVVQADAVATPTEILICPLTTFLVDAPLYRPQLEPSHENGLTTTSQIMADKVGPVRFDRISGVIGHLEVNNLINLDISLLGVLDLANK